MTKLELYLTVKDAAKYLGVSPNTLRYWGREGKVPMHRNPLNGYRLFKTPDLDALVQEIEKSQSPAPRKPTPKNSRRKPK